MEEDFKKAKDLFDSGKYTVVLVKDGDIVTSTDNGIKPLIKFIEDKKDYTGYSAADKVVGKAAALLYTIIGVKNLYATVLCSKGLEVLKNKGINFEYKELPENIKNRTHTGLCPMEETVLNIDDPHEALIALKNKLTLLASHKD